tara:strand:+ start:2010 stop:2756 length:747 start_codon:yes stop_codon:yes gene_type:complete
MKLINKHKSPNYDNRNKSKIKFLIIHYTALRNCKEAISYLCNPNNKVSCHFLISQEGDIFCLVDESKRAWHAGISFWNNYTDINSHSIGIELDYSGSNQNNIFSKKMINSLIKLLNYLKQKYKIKDINILAHSDIAPLRKKDPGKYFPWKILSSNKISFIVNKNNTRDLNNLTKWFAKNSISSREDICIFILGYVGYQINQIKDKKTLKKIIRSYQSHFLQNNVTGNIDQLTLDYMMSHLINLVLTKK